MIQQIQIVLSIAHKVGLVNSVLDSVTFDRVTNALLPDDVATFADWAKFKNVFISLFDTKHSLFADRYKAFQMEWLGPAYEPLQEFVARIRRSVAMFKFADFSENELSTLLILMAMKAPALESLRSLALNALIKTPKESLANVETLLENALMTERDQKLPEQQHVNFVKKVKFSPSSSKKHRHRTSSPSSVSSTSSNDSSSSRRGSCDSCGANHARSQCRLRNAECHACGKSGHIKKVCKAGKRKMDNAQSSSKESHASSRSNKKVGFVRVMPVRVVNARRRPSFAASIDASSLHLQYDSGSDITILSRRDYQNVGYPTLTPSYVKARAADNRTIKLDGYFSATILCSNISKSMDIHFALWT
uniref:CCHC-type domain-containing protein n=1 Tax=Panagrolaimus superbus TaxID=310955 RepID=A0A914Z8A6_9BILA